MKHFNLPILFALAIAGLLLYSCTRSGPCEGSLRLENPIPDTTVAVGDTLFIDLANPPVFVSSEGQISYIPSVMQGQMNVDVIQMENPNDNQRLSILLIIGESVGEAILELEANSACLENQTTFNVTVKAQ